MSLTGPDNPLLCHYFCYYVKRVYDDEMFTIGDTLTCSYGGLGKEISDLQSLRAVIQSLTECGPLEKGMANHFSILALRTPGTV